MKRAITLLIILGIILPVFSFAGQVPLGIVSPPKTLEEAKEAAKQAEKELPGIMREIWKNEALPIWQKTLFWLKINVWFKFYNWLKPEFEKRKQFFKENFKKEKEEIKEEIKAEAPKIGKSLWEKIKGLIK